MPRSLSVEIVAVTGFSPSPSERTRPVRPSFATAPAALSLPLSLPLADEDALSPSPSPSPTETERDSPLPLSLSERPSQREGERETLSLRETETERERDGDAVVRYVLRVTDHALPSTRQWLVSHRYSAFVRLRQKLVKQGFYSLPRITSKSSLLHRPVVVVNDRVAVLSLFLRDALRVIGASNATLSLFLAVSLPVTVPPLTMTTKTEGESAAPPHVSLSTRPHNDLSPRSLLSTREDKVSDNNPPNPESTRVDGKTFRLFRSKSAHTAKHTAPPQSDARCVRALCVEELTREREREKERVSALCGVWAHALSVSLSRNTHIVQHAHYVLYELRALSLSLNALRGERERDRERESLSLWAWLGVSLPLSLSHSLSLRSALTTRAHKSLSHHLGTQDALSQRAHTTSTIVSVRDLSSSLRCERALCGRTLWLCERALWNVWCVWLAYEMFVLYAPHTHSERESGRENGSESPHNVLPQLASQLLLSSQLAHTTLLLCALHCVGLSTDAHTRGLTRRSLSLCLSLSALRAAHRDELHDYGSALTSLFETESATQRSLTTAVIAKLTSLLTYFMHEPLVKLTSILTVVARDIIMILCHVVLFVENIAADVFLCFKRLFSLSFSLSLSLSLSLILGYVYIIHSTHSYRAFRQYLLGFGVLFVYVMCNLCCTVFLLTAESKKRVFRSIDKLIAPYVVHHMAEYQSIYTRFGPLIGKVHANTEKSHKSVRKEVLSSVWTRELRALRDACVRESWDSVRAQIESALNSEWEKHCVCGKCVCGELCGVCVCEQCVCDRSAVYVEDVFVCVDREPCVCESGAQTHRATIDTTRLRNLRFRDKTTSSPRVCHTHSRTLSHTHSVAEALCALTQRSHRENYTVSWFSSHTHEPSHNTQTFTPKSERETADTLSDSEDESAHTHHTTRPHKVQDNENLLYVLVKVQHKGVEEIMTRDLTVLSHIVQVAACLDSRWESLLSLVHGWRRTLSDSLSLDEEAQHTTLMARSLTESRLGIQSPHMVMCAQNVLITTCVYGYKITDELALTMYEIDRTAVTRRVAHLGAYQFLVSGLFHAKMNPYNVWICLSRAAQGPPHTHTSPQSFDSDNESILLDNDDDDLYCEPTDRPALTHTTEEERKHPTHKSLIMQLAVSDFSLIVRINTERRLLYCRLIVAMYEGDVVGIITWLKKLGYERDSESEGVCVSDLDAQFLLFLFRDAMPTKRDDTRTLYTETHTTQRVLDTSHNVLDDHGVVVGSLPHELVALTEFVGMLRSLCVKLHCHCPVLHILALHAKAAIRLHSFSEEELRRPMRRGDFVSNSSKKV